MRTTKFTKWHRNAFLIIVFLVPILSTATTFAFFLPKIEINRSSENISLISDDKYLCYVHEKKDPNEILKKLFPQAYITTQEVQQGSESEVRGIIKLETGILKVEMPITSLKQMIEKKLEWIFHPMNCIQNKMDRFNVDEEKQQIQQPIKLTIDGTDVSLGETYCYDKDVYVHLEWFNACVADSDLKKNGTAVEEKNMDIINTWRPKRSFKLFLYMYVSFVLCLLILLLVISQLTKMTMSNIKKIFESGNDL